MSVDCVRKGVRYTDNGFPGDEDNGTTAAWYIFSVLGMYPICPGKDEYVKFTPPAKSIKIEKQCAAAGEILRFFSTAISV